MDFANLKSLTIHEGEVKEIYCGDVLLWKGGYTNLVPLSTTEDGKTIYGEDYNGDGIKDGYKNGYRIRSGGLEAVTTVGSCTGFIKVTAGDVVRLSGYDVKDAATENAINVADINHNNLGQIVANNSASYGCFQSKGENWDDVISEGNGVYYWIVPSGYGIEYIRVSGYTEADGSKMIVTINEEIE